MTEWRAVIRDGKASQWAIYRGNQFIAKWETPWTPLGWRYSLTIGEDRIGFYDTPEEAKTEADKRQAERRAS